MEAHETNQQEPFEAKGINRISYDVPDSFFPICDAPKTKSWTPCLAAPRLTTRLRAWSRVPLPAQTNRSFSGTIMKRVGFPQSRATRATLPRSQDATRAAADTVNDVCADGMPLRRTRQRLDTYTSPYADHETTGNPPSKLEVAGLNMQAKADVAFCIKENPTSRTRDELRQCRAGHYVKTIPAKRQFNDMFTVGNRLRTYLNILDMPLNTGFQPPATGNSTATSLASFTSPVKPSQGLFKSPLATRSPLSQEPVTPASAMMPPETLPPQSVSPTKRTSRHKSPPIKRDASKISPAVKLLPAESPIVRPSPTKSDSPAPATPITTSGESSKAFKTPSTFPRALQTGLAFANMDRFSAVKDTTSPLQLLPPTAATLASPCPANGLTPSPSIQSPSKDSATQAPTPTRQTNTEPTTPLVSTSGPSGASDDGDDACPIRFLSRLFAQSPAPSLSYTPRLSSAQAVPNFDFGTMSPSFNSVTWMNTTETSPQRQIRGASKSSRRQSEPLVRNSWRAQARRQTLSPQKLVFRGEETFQNQEALSLHVNKPEFGHGSHDASDVVSAAEAEPEDKPSILDGPVGNIEPLDNASKSSAEETLPTTRPAQSSPNEVLNIDMRQNPDIFGARPLPAAPSPILASGPLPSIVEDNGESEASIINTDDGRLEVQFKVTPKFASMVPDSQGSPAKSVTPSPKGIEAESPMMPNTSPINNLHPYGDGKFAGLGIFSEILGSDSPVQSIEGSPRTTSPPTAEDAVENTSDDEIISETPEKDSERRLGSVAQSPSPPLNLSFTAVNANQSKSESDTPKTAHPARSPEKTLVLESLEMQTHDYDSPGRDYMREFIRRSRPKRPSTTEAGSPVAPVVKRQPLGPKSPNTESPMKAKRKHENEKDRNESPLKKASSKPDAKKLRRYGMPLKKRTLSRDKREDDTDRIDVEDPAEVLAQPDEFDPENSAASRRSSRIKSQAVTAPLSKSAIPTPIKIGRSTGASLNSAVRSEQQDLTYQTRMNTRKNKGNAEYPAQFLARQSEEAMSDVDADAEDIEQALQDGSRKCVAWKSPLAAYQEEEQDMLKKKGTKTAKTVRTTGIAKPVTRAKTTADKERTARLAEHFGMVSNGTPAKPQRVTRSRMQV